ncbi:MAG: hypothetical protein QOK24_1268, partial [Verrucomicrobiota bacterium]
MDAQVGNDNPTGPAGMFNGTITTGGSYDAYTGNVTRRVTDLVVSGAVGSYPLAFTRTSNSRFQSEDQYQFGSGGTWRHNFNWTLSSYPALGTDYPHWYWVSFPDGRIEAFVASSTDPLFRAGPGIADRFQPLDLATMLAYLTLPDGGKVEFAATAHWSWYSYRWNDYSWQATAIIDPYGQRTSLTYNGDGSLNTIQEPAGRWIQLIYGTTPWLNSYQSHDIVIDHIQASDGRVVQYNYNATNYGLGGNLHTYLDNVVYPADSGSPAPTAHYTYQAPNVPDYDGQYNAPPLLASCDDPMYGGSMQKISYTYATGFNPDGTYAVSGQILSENNSTTGQAVSTLTVNGESRTETRGDGPSRSFNYSGGVLINYTDFKGQSSYISYDGNGYKSAFEDARHQTTTFLREGIIGAMSVVTHPGDNSTASFGYSDANNPYYLSYQTDERENTTWFSRNANHQVERIDYPNGAYETFSYNNFGQVYSHRLTTSGIETFDYDWRGMKYASTNPDGTTYYYYDGYDRLEHVTDPRWNTTWFQYNVRGQTTRITHPDLSFIQTAYNSDGTTASITDELGHTSSYTYDEYKRVVATTNPLNQTTTSSYALDWANPLLHTTQSVKYVISPMNKNVVFDYDANFRKIDQVAALGTPDEAWTLFEYDAVGNLTKITDPLWHATTFGYDNRNRQTSITDALGSVTTIDYDAVGNKNWIKHATGTPEQTLIQFPEYDSMNRLTRQIDEKGVTTTMGYDSAGNLAWNNDGNGNHYFYTYDYLSRRTVMTYPNGATERYSYDAAGNLATYTNRAGNVQTFFNDNRNRQTGFDWNDGYTPQVRTTYDVASRVTQIWNWDATIDNTYFDDNALAS